MTESLFLKDAAPGWPFFGARVRPGGETALTLYFTEIPWERRGWSNIERMLGLFSLTAGDLAKCRLRGVFDCIGISFSSSGEKILKIYTKFPAPAKAGGLAFLEELHGARRLAFFKECLEISKAHPARYWTNAYRFNGKQKKPVSVKTEVHFREPVPAEKLGKPFLSGSGFLAENQIGLLTGNDCAVTTLAAEKSHLTVYFTC